MSIKDTLRPTYHMLKAALRPAQRRRHAKRQFQLDYERFEKASILATGPKDREQWIGVLTIDYHRIEKGLALPDMRAGFGHKVIMRLIENCQLYVARFGPDRYTEIVASCIQAYVDRHREMGREFPELEAFLATSPPTQDQGGVKTVSGKDIRAAAMIDADGFFGSRHSIRDFGPQPVSEETLSHAVSLARNAPSVCNRQAGRAYCSTDKEIIAKALSYQNGNSGFGHTVPALFVITSDMRIFEKSGERNQGWVDGGLFAMALVYALHALGLGACMLNWSQDHDQDDALRAAFEIPDSQGVITMLAVGHIPDDLLVAQSPRRPVGDVFLPLTPKG